MILNFSIGEEIEQDAKEMEGHHIPETIAGPSSSHSADIVEKAEPKVVSSTVRLSSQKEQAVSQH